jgi:sugar O-acyltransferase (sialic acid O-acetyltransferase NeuD family)
MKRKIIIIGYDPEIIEMILSTDDYSIDGYVDVNKAHNDYFNLNYFGNDEHFTSKYSYQSSHQLSITLDDTSKREFLYNFYKKKSFKFATIISKKSNISKYSRIGEGCIIQDLTNVSFNINIGNNVKINTCANLMHDVVVGDHSTLAPNCVILGYVKIGQCCFIGSNSTLLPSITVNANSILGAGCVATKNLETGIYAGVPAKRIK